MLAINQEIKKSRQFVEQRNRPIDNRQSSKLEYS
jgi:hypothetical protein